MNAFLTGSQVYGTPREDSDIDLCVVVSASDRGLLKSLADHCDGSAGDSLRFGRLNLICLSLTEFEAWKTGTGELIAIKPVTREKAVEVIEAAKGRGF